MTEKIPPCTEVEKISAEDISDSESELRQRMKINKHLSECNDYNCYLIRVDRINKGLY